MPGVWRGHLLAAVLLLVVQPLQAESQGDAEKVALKPIIGLIIDDLGDRLEDGLRAIALPGQVTYAILPRTTYSRQFAELVHSQGKEVMLHQPMQAMNGKAMGPGGLSLHMTQKALRRNLRANLLSVPHARGINNHMGSLLTRHPGVMSWLMYELKKRDDLYFIDSSTTRHSVAQKVALEYQVPATRRNIFLDHERNEAVIAQQFERLIAQAKAVGSSLAIGHPYPETLAVLERILPTLEERGVVLVPVSRFIDERNKRRDNLWQASWSPSQRDVKSLKR